MKLVTYLLILFSQSDTNCRLITLFLGLGTNPPLFPWATGSPTCHRISAVTLSFSPPINKVPIELLGEMFTTGRGDVDPLSFYVPPTA
ncbi:hypothetical protein Hypma_005002 [Hypsizygus marmoreus]|uniref:Uncharacterized protein n=1 Tax=Hypsizygus marmoreus TaxID=39966 RepID=A0A369JXM5_HYPMA|nr:hypothetical protein Hypma_005002 [Hypsizygus marmoreus]